MSSDLPAGPARGGSRVADVSEVTLPALFVDSGRRVRLPPRAAFKTVTSPTAASRAAARVVLRGTETNKRTQEGKLLVIVQLRSQDL